jgi:hypothetical protein
MGGLVWKLVDNCLDRHIATDAESTREIKAWQESRNRKAVKANWQFINQDARVNLKKLYPTT